MIFNSMLSRRKAYNKIFNSIVLPVSIDVVDYFGGLKITTELFLHYQAVFANIFIFSFMGVIW